MCMINMTGRYVNGAKEDNATKQYAQNPGKSLKNEAVEGKRSLFRFPWFISSCRS
jgi:hypothetical protein